MSGQPVAITAGPDGGLELLAAGADGSLWHNRLPLDALPLEGWIELHLLSEEDLKAMA